MVKGASSVLRVAAVVVAGLAGGCSKGGGGSSPKIAVGFESASTSSAEGTTAQVVLALVSKVGPLTEDMSVTVHDAGTGTSVAGADHDFTADRVVTFPAGSDDGATQSVDVQIVSDLSIEGGDETLRLALADPSPGLGMTKIKSHTLTLEETDFADLTFVGSGSATADEATPDVVEVELQLDPGESLDVDVQVTVLDDGTGSATSGVDYMSFAQQTLTFPSGSPDGTRRSVTLQPIEDTAVEGDETAMLVVANPSGGAQLSGSTSHMVTITDDDLSSGPFLVVTGALLGGAAAPVSDNDSFDLGSQPDGAGPNQALQLLVQNAGAQPVTLPPLSMTGDTRDFSVVLNDTGANPAPLVGAAAFPFATLADDAVFGASLDLQPALLGALAENPLAIVDGVALPGGGEVTLELERVPLPLAPDALVEVDGQAVPAASLLGDLTLWTGRVPDLEGSSAFLALSSAGCHGWIRLGDQLGTVNLVTEYGSGTPVVHWIWDAQLEGAYTGQQPSLCEGELFPPGASFDPFDTGGLPAPPSESLPVGVTLSNCRIAIETDFQFYSKFNDAGAATQYATQLIAAVSEVYQRDVQASLSIAYLGIHTNSNDGWSTPDSGGTTSQMLDEFRSAWAGNFPAPADVAHFISGASLGGGIAYVGVLCNQSFGFGVSANINGNINWGTFTGSPSVSNWDFIVVAHELGHNFGALHTHDYCPPLDECYSNCNGTTSCTPGTLMSYCHTCGGIANMHLEFHQHVAEQMRSSIGSSCLADSTLAPGTTISLTVSLEPTTGAGAKSAVLRLSHDAPNAPSPIRMNLSGTATP